MRGYLIIASTIATLAAVCAAAYAELVLDVRIPRSALKYVSALGVNASYSLVEYNELEKEFRAQYGERAKTSLKLPSGRVTVKLDGQVVEQRTLVHELEDVIGLFAVSPGASQQDKFPFRLGPNQSAGSVERRLVEALKQRFGKALPEGTLAFSDTNWTIDSCVPIVADHLGWVGRFLPYKRGTACVVTWKVAQPSSMLVSVSVADGDPWMRPFKRRICRMVTEAALIQMAARVGLPTLNYAGCVLADRPRRSGAQEVLSDQLYQLRPDGTLALII